VLLVLIHPAGDRDEQELKRIEYSRHRFSDCRNPDGRPLCRSAISSDPSISSNIRAIRPRYFRRGYGTGASRLGYAVGQIFWTHNDSGKSGFNFSEIVGNSTAVAISQSYYPDNRDARDAGVRLASQIGVDAAANVLKEFWPDILKKFGRK
jgi:hypothetical protein